MQFMMIEKDGRTAVVVKGDDGALHGLFADDAGYPGDLDALIRLGPQALADVGAVLADAPRVEGESVRYLPPFRAAEKIICVGLNYHEHVTETRNEVQGYPVIFSRFNSSLIGHEDAIILPRLSAALDYEAEMVAVIGRGGRHIPLETALDHVAGYSLFNDASIRDYQMKTSQWTVGKNFDATGAFGPAFVTADELPRGAHGLRIECRLNGEVVQSASTADLIFDVAQLVHLMSEVMTLQPGDLIVTGTPGGIGGARTPPLWMKDGDVCEVEVEGIGLLRNGIRRETS